MKNAELFKQNYAVRICLFVLAMMLSAQMLAAEVPAGLTKANVSYGKTCTINGASSDASAKLVNENLDFVTEHESSYVNNKDAVSLQVNDVVVVDLGADEIISDVKLDWEGATAKEYTISVSSDNSTWVTVAHETNNDAIGSTFHIYKNYPVNIKGRYVKIVPLSAGESQWGIKLNEILVYAYDKTSSAADNLWISTDVSTTYVDTPIQLSYFAYNSTENKVTLSVAGEVLTVKDPDNVETGILGQYTYTPTKYGQYVFTYAAEGGKSATAYVNVEREFKAIPIESDKMVWIEEGTQGDENNMELAKAFDTNYDNEWRLALSSNDFSNVGFVIDLKGTYTISKLTERYSAAASPKIYSISYSLDGETFTPAKVETDHVATAADIVTVFDEAHQFNARYIRFHCTKAHTGDYGLILKRFELEGAKVSVPTPDTTAPEFDVTPSCTNLKAKSVDIVMNATDASGKYVYYKVEQKSPAVETKTLHYTSMVSGSAYTDHITGLTSNTSYTFEITAYDVYGNASEVQTVSFTTPELTIKSFTVSPTIIPIAKNGGDSDALTFKVIAEDDTDITGNTTFNVEFLEGAQVVDYNSTTRKFSTKTDVVGHEVWKVTATTTGGQVATANVEVFVYETAIQVKYKLSASDADYTSITGSIGNLKANLNTSINTDDNGYLGVYELHFESGNINDADIKTIREMAGAGKQGNLHILDMTGVKFTADPSYAYDLPADATPEQIAEQNQKRLDNCFAMAVDTVYTTNLVPVGVQPAATPCYIHTGGTSIYDVNLNIRQTTSDQGETLIVDEIEAAREAVFGYQILPSHIFDHCVNLVEVTLPTDIKQFGTACFNGCTNLTTVENYGNVIDFGANAFIGCTSLTTFDLSQASDRLRIVGTGMFMHCYNLTSVTMRNTIKVIDGSAFAFCPKFNLNDGALPTDLIRIGQYAFFTNGKKSISKVVFGNNLKSIDGFAFDTNEGSGGSNQEMIADFTNATNLEFIGMRAFSDNKKMTMLPADGTLPNSIKSIETYAFAGTAIVNAKLPVNPYYQTVKYGSFGWNNALTSVIIPANVKYIRDVAFVTDNNMRVTLLDKTKLTTIGVSSFDGCSSLTDDFVGVDHVISIGNKGFAACTNLTDQSGIDLMSHLTRINDETFASCTSLTKVILPASITEMGDRSFANCTALRTVNVNNPVAPTMDHHDLTYTQKEIIDNVEKDVTHDSDIFYGSQPNQIEVVFTDEMKTGDDASGYKTYRANAHFMNVMKRTMSDAATAYEVPAQFGADVTLSRTIGAGKWNTLVLPFGLSNNAGRTDHTANVLKAALGEGGKVAMYRGLNKDRNTFLFLLYEDGNAIKPFLPVIVYTNADVSTLSFEDVDVNYSGVAESNKVATATLDGAAGSAYGAYNGDRDTDMEATELGYFDGTDKTAYRFAGTFKTIYSVGYENAKVTAAEESKIIGASDFIIQNNKFYEVTNPSADRRYTLKAFRGWFQKIPEAPSGAKVATVEIAAFDGLDFGGETTEIVNVDLATGKEIKPQDIYSTDGRLVKRGATSTDGLAKGIYIIGGRKIVVK